MAEQEMPKQFKILIKSFPFIPHSRVVQGPDGSNMWICEWQIDDIYFEIEWYEGELSAMFKKKGEEPLHWEINPHQ